MDILKARKKAKEAKEAQAARDDEARGSTQPPSPAKVAGGATRPPALAQEADDAAHDAAHDVAYDAARDADSDSAVRASNPPRSVGAAATVRRDPLEEFLASYDEGELAHVPDLTGEVPLEVERRYLSFQLAGEVYAADIMEVREILKLFTLTEVPRAPKEILGVLSKRGVVMPVVDLAAILGLRSANPDLDKSQRVLVVGDAERVCGLRVDRVQQVVRLGQRHIEEVPPSLGNRNAHMLLGLGRPRSDGTDAAQILILLDIEAVLDHFSTLMGIEPERREATR